MKMKTSKTKMESNNTGRKTIKMFNSLIWDKGVRKIKKGYIP